MTTHEIPVATRTLRQMVLPATLRPPGNDPLHYGLYVDCETTGLDWRRDEVIEVALLPFSYTSEDRIAQVRHHQAQSYRRDPGRPLSAEISALTGLTDDDVRAQRIDVEAANTLIERCELIIAHNARFDRPFLERVLPATRDKPWACSRLEVPWIAAGCPSTALHCLLCHHGVFARDRHRALADCEAGVWLLAQPLAGAERTVLAALRASASAETRRLWAAGAPFAAKDELRARGYRWMPQRTRGIDRSWWTEVVPAMLADELAWLEAVYRTHRDWKRARFNPDNIPVRTVTAYDRWRADPTDLVPR